MKRICTSCGVTIPIEPGSAIAEPVRCWGCTAQTSTSVSVAQGQPFSEYQFDLPQPKNFTRELRGDTLVLTLRWLSWDYLMPTLGCLIMAPVAGPFLVGWLLAVGTNHDWKLLIFGLPFAVLGFGRAYQVLAGYVNDTRCTVTRCQITINHGPLPWPGNRQLDATTISYLYTNRRSTGSRRKHDPLDYRYTVRAVLHTGDEVLLVPAIQEEHAAYFEQEIARFLAIKAPALKSTLSHFDQS